MPAINMEGPLDVPANPSGGKSVNMNPFSGPEGSPLDNDQDGNHSTGALNTGIGMVPTTAIEAPADPNVRDAGFRLGDVPGVTMPDGTATDDAILTAIGGGYSEPAVNGEAETDPLEALPVAAFGNGATRDAGGGVGRAMAMVEADAITAVGEEIADGHFNRAERTLTEGQSAFGVEGDADPDPEP